MAVPPEPLAPRASSQEGGKLYYHGTAVAVHGKGALILGPSGSGKSSLALAMIALGAELISDDGVWLEDAQLQRPATAPPLIEARGVGLLNAGSLCTIAPLFVVVDLSRPEPDRLPPRRMVVVHDQKAELILADGQTTLAPSLLHLLRFGRAEV